MGSHLAHCLGRVPPVHLSVGLPQPGHTLLLLPVMLQQDLFDGLDALAVLASLLITALPRRHMGNVILLLNTTVFLHCIGLCRHRSHRTSYVVASRQPRVKTALRSVSSHIVQTIGADERYVESRSDQSSADHDMDSSSTCDTSGCHHQGRRGALAMSGFGYIFFKQPAVNIRPN